MITKEVPLQHTYTLLSLSLLLRGFLGQRSIRLAFDAAYNLLFHCRASHLIVGIVLIGRLHQFGNGGLGLQFFVVQGFLMDVKVPLLVAAGDCSNLVLLFQEGRFSVLSSPLELSLQSRMWLLAETEWGRVYQWVSGSCRCW